MKFIQFTLLLLTLSLFSFSCGDKNKTVSDSDSPAVTDTENTDTDAEESDETVKDDSENNDNKDSDDENADNESPDNEVPDTSDFPPENCEEITIGDIKPNPNYENMYDAAFTPELGDSDKQDLFQIQFWGEQTGGAFDLGSGNNASSKTVEQSVRVLEDLPESVGAAAKMYFQKSGSLTIENFIKSDDGKMTGESKGKISNLVLVESVYDDTEEKLVPVENGKCLYSSQISWDTLSCVPKCIPENRVCGDDGCGNSCGTCSENETCTADGQCASLSCREITIDEFRIRQDKRYVSYEADIKENMRGNAPDRFVLEISNILISELPMEFNLGSITNKDYSTCLQCALLFEDIGNETDYFSGAAKTYFQQSGGIRVDEMIPDKYNSMTNESRGATIPPITLIEVTIDPSSGVTTPVQGGDCVVLKQANSWDTIMKCDPRCETWEYCDETSSPTCKPRDGYCHTNDDCSDGKECGSDNRCGEPEGPNLIANGDFESGMEGDFPKFWGGAKTDISSDDVALVTGNGGGNAVQLIKTNNLAMRFTSKPFSMTTGLYQCTFDVKGSGDVKFSFYHNGLVSSGWKYGPIIDTQTIDSSSWETKSGTFELDADVPDIFELVFYASNTKEAGGHLNIDNVICRKY